MKQTKLDQTYQGRDQYAAKFEQNDFEKFVNTITNEWDQWKILIEGEWVKTPYDMIEATNRLGGEKTVLMVDEKNKTIHFLKRSTYEFNLDKRKDQ